MADVTSQNTEETLSDDDDLPDVFPTPKTDEAFQEEDVLFAKFRSCPYWPAVFYRYGSVKKKQKKKPKAWVCFFDEVLDLTGKVNNSKHIVPLPVCNLKRFTCDNRDEIIKASSKCKGFLQALEVAEDYMRKRALGKMAAFFEHTPEDEGPRSEDEEEDDDDEGRGEGLSGEEEEESNQVPQMDFINDDDDDEVDDDDVDDKENKSSTINSFREKSPENPSEETRNIMHWIRSNSKGILKDITSGKIYSQRHDTFTKGNQSSKDNLRWYTGFGKLDENSGEEVFRLLLSWFQEELQCSTYNAIGYVSDVWLPEAMIYAISDLNNVSYKEAEHHYLT